MEKFLLFERTKQFETGRAEHEHKSEREFTEYTTVQKKSESLSKCIECTD